MEENFIYGKNSVFEALKSEKRNINRIILSKGIHSDTKINEIISMAKKSKIIFQFVPKEKFYDYKEFNHQGVIAFIAPLEYVQLNDFLAKKRENAKILVLDNIQDPHNFGAIVRTSVCAGFDAILISQRKNVLITSAVEKSSAGAINHIPIIAVNSLSSAIEKLKKNDYWIIASDAKGKDNYFDVDYTNMNVAVVLGGEGAGVSKTILKMSDFTVKIPMMNDFNSLNVSNAAAVIIYEVIKQTIQKSKNIV